MQGREGFSEMKTFGLGLDNYKKTRDYNYARAVEREKEEDLPEEHDVESAG